MKVFTYNEDARILSAKEWLEGERGDARIHLLPIPTRDASLMRVAAKDYVFGYAITDELSQKLHLLGAHVKDLEKDAIFIEENAHLTAEATMGALLSDSTSPKDRRIGIIGYGRIGAALCRMLLFFGAGVRVFTERDEVRASLGAAGIESRPISYEEGEALDLAGLDLIIQTAPRKIFTEKNAPHCPLYNLAAAKFIGEGVDAKTLSALPAKVCYRSGGKALASAVLRAITTEEKRKTL